MLDVLTKTVLTGLGALSVSQKLVEEAVDELRSRYRLSEEEGKALLDRLSGMTREGKERTVEMLEEEMNRVIDRMGLVKRSDYELLLRRVEALEQKLSNAAGE